MRGHIAINLSLDARTERILLTANKDMTITGENGASVTLRKGEQFYAVRASSLGENMFYIVRLVTGEKKCTCASYKPCAHEIAVATGRSVADIKAARAKVAKAKKQSAKVTKPVVESSKQPVVKVAKVAPTDLSTKGQLNTSRAFSLMR